MTRRTLTLALALNVALVGAAVAPLAWGPHCWPAGYLDGHKVRECSDGMWFIDYEVEDRGFGYSYPLVKEEGLWLTTSDLTDARAAEQAAISSTSSALLPISDSVRSAETRGGPTASSTWADGSLVSFGSVPQPPTETVAPPSCYVYHVDVPCVAVEGLDATFLTESVPIVACESGGRPWVKNPASSASGSRANCPAGPRRRT